MKIRDRIKEFKRVKASELEPNPLNWRTHSNDQRDAMKGLLSEIGIAGAVIAYKTNGGGLRLIDGHLRAEQLANNAEIPTLILDVNEDEARKILATFDPISAMAGSDQDMLREVLAGIEIENAAVQAMLDELLAEGDGANEITEGLTDPDDVPEPPKEAITKPGDLWIMGEHRLLCGDNAQEPLLDVLFGSDRATIVVTSPPYNQNIANFSKSGMHRETKWVDQTRHGSYEDNRPEDKYQEWQTTSIIAWSAYLSKDASIFYNHKNRFRDKQCISPWIWLERTGAKVRQEIIWMREGSVTQNMRGFMPVDERIFWLYFGDDFVFNDSTEIKTWSTVWRINSHKDIGESTHGCAFPVELPARCIRACSLSGDIVFEPYCGSGTTLIAAHQHGRICYATELEPKYCDVIVKRWEEFTGQKARRESR